MTTAPLYCVCMHSLKSPLPTASANLAVTAPCGSQQSLHDTTVASWLLYLGAKVIQQGK